MADVDPGGNVGKGKAKAKAKRKTAPKVVSNDGAPKRGHSEHEKAMARF